MAASKKKFKTEVQQLLNIVIHSLYTKKEIFLRELISNASDAIDRARFESLQNAALLEDDPHWKIRLIPDAEAKTLTIEDNGIGMSREEVEQNLGTIARSGTRAFMEELQAQNAANRPELIGQFGVGFYSAFMVADKVTVVTRRAGDPASATEWTSEGDGAYTLAEATRAKRGTSITLHLREDAAEYTEEWRLRKIVKQYSDFVEYPIAMDITRDETPVDDEGKPVKDAKPVKTTKEETLNSMKALWRRPKSDLKAEEYEEFYRHVSHDYGKPLETIHFKGEGATEFTALVYLPEHAPWNIFTREERKGLHLYVKNVFITDDCKEILPEYLRFVSGVVDSSDLPLNVSRETLQDDAIIQRIRKSLLGKILGALKDLREKRPDDYAKFWKELGKVLKEGLHFDFGNREKLQELVLFESTKTDAGKYASLKEYVDRMPAAQKEIYYLTGDSRQVLENSPYLEAFRSRDYEVLFLTDPIDEWVVQAVTEYGGKKLVAINRGDIELESDDEKKAKEEERGKQQGELKELLGHIQETLKEQVKEVRLSNRLTDSACCLVADEHGMNAHMERIFKAMNQDVPVSKRILELNPAHPVVGVMKGLFEADKSNPRLADYIELLHTQAQLNEGTPLKNPLRFTKLVSELMVQAGK
jgi:molecular chaperone HtpG